jgi:hypothetical protein
MKTRRDERRETPATESVEDEDDTFIETDRSPVEAGDTAADRRG